MIKYEFKDDGIFYVDIEGKISLEEMSSYLHEFKTVKSLPKDMKFLYNLQKAEVGLKEDDLLVLAELADEVTAHFSSVRTAFLVGSPDVTSFSYIFSLIKKNDHSIRNVFSIKQNALEWLHENDT